MGVGAGLSFLGRGLGCPEFGGECGLRASLVLAPPRPTSSGFDPLCPAWANMGLHAKSWHGTQPRGAQPNADCRWGYPPQMGDRGGGQASVVESGRSMLIRLLASGRGRARVCARRRARARARRWLGARARMRARSRAGGRVGGARAPKRRVRTRRAAPLAACRNETLANDRSTGRSVLKKRPNLV